MNCRRSPAHLVSHAEDDHAPVRIGKTHGIVDRHSHVSLGVCPWLELKMLRLQLVGNGADQAVEDGEDLAIAGQAHALNDKFP